MSGPKKIHKWSAVGERRNGVAVFKHIQQSVLEFHLI